MVNQPAANVGDIYVRGVKQQLRNYWAAWSPVSKWALGDVGVLNGSYFEKVADLASLKIPFAVTADDSPSPIDFVSDSGVSIKMKLAGETNESFTSVPKASAGVQINFSTEGGFVIQAPATFEPTIADPLSLQESVLRALEAGTWQPEWAVLVRLVTAPVATIVISSTANAGLELSANANLTAGLMDLAKADLGLSVTSQRGNTLKYIGAQDVTPFFQLAMVKTRLFRPPQFKVRSMRTVDLPLRTPAAARAGGAGQYLDIVTDDEVIRAP